MSDITDSAGKGGNNILYMSNFIHENDESVNTDLDEKGKKEVDYLQERPDLEKSSNEAGSRDTAAASDELTNDSMQDQSDEAGEVDEQPFFIPTPLILYQRKMYITAAAFALLAAALYVAFKNLTPLVFLMGSAYMVYKGISVERDFKNGNLVEVGVVCVAVRPSAVRDRVSLTFKANEEDGGSYYRFVVPAKKYVSEEFIVDSPYVIYFDVSNPHALIAYVQV